MIKNIILLSNCNYKDEEVKNKELKWLRGYEKEKEVRINRNRGRKWIRKWMNVKGLNREKGKKKVKRKEKKNEM